MEASWSACQLPLTYYYTSLYCTHRTPRGRRCRFWCHPGTCGTRRCSRPRPPSWPAGWSAGCHPGCGSSSPGPWTGRLWSGGRPWRRRPRWWCRPARPSSSTAPGAPSQGGCTSRTGWPSARSWPSCSPPGALYLRNEHNRMCDCILAESGFTSALRDCCLWGATLTGGVWEW